MQVNTCGKIIYADEREARKELKRIKKNPRGNGSGKPLWQMTAYQCPNCNQWHLGHNHKKKKHGTAAA